ncbi:putative cytokinetic ring protein SteA [Marinicrinis sediminis]|uniref:Cytokinetic ring protein SteA n=1 Tax=Marinicrinis sediminis TaxID=1652465 RepID=A0ABW5RCX1_9BACL
MMRLSQTTNLSGTIQVHTSTKQLLRSIQPRQIAVICHENIDEMAANGFIEAKVKAVINAAKTMDGSYPSVGAKRLLDAAIPIFDIDPLAFHCFQSGNTITITEDAIQVEDNQITCQPFTFADYDHLYKQAMRNMGSQLNRFIDNTLTYASQEKELVIDRLKTPPLRTRLGNQHVVVVVRGSGYKEDLSIIRAYIQDYRPVLIGVDGGADALLEHGFMPNLIIGDMDSVSDHALRCGAELLVHAYPDGRAPGLDRLEKLHVPSRKICAKGTSEDIAMLLAYEQGAELIVTLGTHTHMIDFLEKGRKGMASTLLVRMKVGSKLVDAKGVSKLYQRPVRFRSMWHVLAAALFPLVMLFVIHPGFRQFLDTIRIYFQISFK